MICKKKEQLGMHPSTASGRLVKDVLWSLIIQTGQDKCCKCCKPMSRETFSIEHIKPWLDSDDPIGLYFDLKNIGFSHISCNISDARKPHKTGETAKERGARNQRESWNKLSKEEQKKRRREKYLKYNC